MTDSSRSPEVPAARLVRAGDGPALAELFAAIQDERFHPHDLTREEADRLAAYRGRDVYAVLEAGNGRFVAYGLLRGWDEGYAVPSLGIAVRAGERGRGHGRRMMHWLATEARRRGADRIRLRVDPGNTPARRLYEQLGYEPIGEERGEIVMVLELSDGARPDHGPEGR